MPKYDYCQIFDDQDPMDMVELCNKFEAQFKYISNELNAHGFKDYVRQFMKSKKSHITKKYRNEGHVGCLLGMDGNQ